MKNLAGHFEWRSGAHLRPKTAPAASAATVELSSSVDVGRDQNHLGTGKKAIIWGWNGCFPKNPEPLPKNRRIDGRNIPSPE